jgi:hypothetical protein
MSEDARRLISNAASGLLEQVPALKPLKLVIRVDLHGRGDTQQFRLVLPECEVTKDIAADSKVQVEMRREEFNRLTEHNQLKDWRQAFVTGRVKATGVEQYLKLIQQVVDKQEERSRLKKSRH